MAKSMTKKTINHEERSHAVLSASSSHRWLNCPASVRLEEEYPETTSEVAAEGTAAHELAEYKLRKNFKLKPGKRPQSDYETAEMDDMTDDYRSYVDSIYEDCGGREKASVYIETRVDYGGYAPGGFGTADCIIFNDTELHIIDLKYGKGVLVSAVDNPQLKLYALGVLSALDYVDFKTVYLHIFQPRRENISEFAISIDEIYAWGEWVKPIAEEAYNGSENQCAGDWCTFCKAQAKCRAHARTMFTIAEKAESESPTELTDEEIDELLPKLEAFTKWAKAVMSYAEEQALNKGKKWTEFKLVQARTNRKYVDEVKVAEALSKAGYQEIYKKSLLGISDMEKLIGKKDFKTILVDTGLVEKPEGGLTLVSRADRRDEIDINNFYGFTTEVNYEQQ